MSCRSFVERITVLLGVLTAQGCGTSAPPVILNDLITKRDVPAPWPLSVDPVRVNCGDGTTTIFLEAAGRAYPVNNAAHVRPDAYTGKLDLNADEEPLFKADPRMAKYGKLHYPIEPIIAVAIKRCKQAGLTTLE